MKYKLVIQTFVAVLTIFILSLTSIFAQEIEFEHSTQVNATISSQFGEILGRIPITVNVVSIEVDYQISCHVSEENDILCKSSSLSDDSSIYCWGDNNQLQTCSVRDFESARESVLRTKASIVSTSGENIEILSWSWGKSFDSDPNLGGSDQVRFTWKVSEAENEEVEVILVRYILDSTVVLEIPMSIVSLKGNLYFAYADIDLQVNQSVLDTLGLIHFENVENISENNDTIELLDENLDNRWLYIWQIEVQVDSTSFELNGCSDENFEICTQVKSNIDFMKDEIFPQASQNLLELETYLVQIRTILSENIELLSTCTEEDLSCNMGKLLQRNLFSLVGSMLQSVQSFTCEEGFVLTELGGRVICISVSSLNEERFSQLESLVTTQLSDNSNVEEIIYDRENNKIEILHTEELRVLGLFPVNVNVRTTVSTQGEVMTQLPWWSFLASRDRKNTIITLD